MKKILLAITCVCFVFFAQAQYWQIPNINAGTNPGDLNNDTEQPFGATTTWTSLLASTATPTWSAATTIPFAFQFNGSAVTQFMASSTGIVTFDIGTTLTAPTSTNTALPSASIPDNSVCIWGIQASGANDGVYTKTFGTAPNRQFWIQYNSVSISSNANAWCYWSVVLEETSNNVYIVDHRSSSNNGPVTLALTAGVQLNSTTAYSVAGSPTLNTMASTVAADDPSDNTYYTFIPGMQPSDDIVGVSATATDYFSAGANVPIELEVRNHGTNPITSYVIKYQEGTNTPVSQTVTGVNIPSLGYDNQTFTTQFNVSSAGTYDFKVWAELPSDANNSNDTVGTILYGAAFIPKRVVTMEEPTGTWCGWCTRGIVYMDSIHVAQPNDVAVIAVHNNDPMDIGNYDTYLGSFFSGYPSLVVDRKIELDPSDAFTAYSDYIGDFGFADITQSHDQSNAPTSFTVNIEVKPAIDLSGDYRLAMVVTEDDVTGTGSGWDQANYYSSQSNNIPLSGAGYNFQTLPDPVPASQINYDFVAREVVGTPQGQAGSLPSTMTANQTYNHSFTYNKLASYQGAKMNFLVLLLNGTTGEIMNTSKGSLYPLGTADLVKSNQLNITAYPNPVQDKMSLDLDVNIDLHNASYSIMDISGRMLKNVKMGNIAKNMTHTYQVDASTLSAGSYLISINSNEGSYSAQFTKK
jgi:hypothetical protein